MLSPSLAALAAAVWCWSATARSGSRRLRCLPGGPRSAGGLRLARARRFARGLRRPRPAPDGTLPHAAAVAGPVRVLVVMLGAAVVGALLAGPGGAVATVLMAGTALGRWRARRDRRAEALASTALADTLSVLVAELRAGAHPAGAADAAASDARADVAHPLRVAAAAARMGGDVPAALRGAAGPAVRPALGRLADAWALADRHGVPLADLVATVQADVAARARFTAAVQARLAGPRATAAVLAALPLLGLTLGQAMGAGPLRVLADTAAGQVLLVVGAGLACAGVCWSARLMSRVVRA